MDKIKVYKTEDESTGLYSETQNDIYHSKTGALKEAEEKFVIPAKCIDINEIRLLDVCSGVGYNLKAYIKNNKSKKIYAVCLEKEMELSVLSVFIKDGIDDIGLKIKILESLIENGIGIEYINNVLEQYLSEFGSDYFLDESVAFLRHLKNLGHII